MKLYGNPLLFWLICFLLVSGIPGTALAAATPEELASLPKQQQISQLKKWFSTTEGRSEALKQALQLAHHLPASLEALCVQGDLPLEFVSEIWTAGQQQQVRLTPGLELAIVLHYPGLVLPDVLRGFKAATVRELLVLAGGYRAVGDQKWAEQLTEMHQVLEACTEPPNAARFAAECRAEYLAKYSKPIAAELLRIQAEIAANKIHSGQPAAVDTADILLRLDSSVLQGMEEFHYLLPAIESLAASPLPAERTRILSEANLAVLLELSKSDESLAQAAARLLTAAARDAVHAEQAAYGMHLLEQSFAFYPKGVAEQAVLVAELSQDSRVFTSKELAERLSALPLRPIGKPLPPEPVDTQDDGEVGKLALAVFLVVLVAGIVIAVVSVLLLRDSSSGKSSAREKQTEVTEKETQELVELLKFFGLNEHATTDALTSSYHTTMMLNRSRGDQAALKKIEKKYLRAMKLLRANQSAE